ncbi:MAG: hypothetical protein ACOX6T_15380 [Myxococcales bacterium]
MVALSRPLLARLVAFSFCLPASSALASGEVTEQQIQALGRWGFTLAYLGQTVTHPGAQASVQYRLFGSGRPHQIFSRGYLGGYLHPRSHVGLLTGLELGYRATASFGLSGELSVGAGYQHTFLAAPVYEVGAGGAVSEVHSAGRPGFAPSLSLGVGWDWGSRGGPPLTVTLRPQAWLLVPYAHTTVVRFGVVLGITYSL